jgi:alpha-beta hydrolase superfamily lysophospholipase
MIKELSVVGMQNARGLVLNAVWPAVVAAMSSLSTLYGCGTQTSGGNDQLTASRSGALEAGASYEKFSSAWQKYVAGLPVSDLQEGCVPEWRRPAPGRAGGSRGVVFLVHGFTACPQQFFKWSEALTAEGFEVVLPLMPGMGRKRPLGGRDFIDGLPADASGRDGYLSFTNMIAQLAHSHPVPVKVIGGLSVGGTVAADAAARFPDVFTRAFVVTPLLEVADFRARFVLNALELVRSFNVPLPRRVLKQMIGWGPGCEDEISRNPPRAGICDFRVEHVLAVQSYGHQTLSAIGPARIPVQILGVGGDPAANNGSIGRMARGFAKGSGVANTSACLYPADVNHSMFSEYDAPNENKYWIAGLLSQASNFVVNGTFFPQMDGSRGDARLSKCAL